MSETEESRPKVTITIEMDASVSAAQIMKAVAQSSGEQIVALQKEIEAQSERIQELEMKLSFAESSGFSLTNPQTKRSLPVPPIPEPPSTFFLPCRPLGTVAMRTIRETAEAYGVSPDELEAVLISRETLAGWHAANPDNEDEGSNAPTAPDA